MFSGIRTWIEKKVVNCMLPSVDPNRVVLDVTPDATTVCIFDHTIWDALLKQFVRPHVLGSVRSNCVDYQGLAKDPLYAEYCTALATAPVAELAPNEQLALYINAYNCLCIGLILTEVKGAGKLPSSINDLSTRGKEVWDLPAGVIGGEEVTLAQIEHHILRKQWREPRVHACIVCASASCPDLRIEAYVADRINAQMDEQCCDWISNDTKGSAVNQSTITLSRILLWFKEDFEAVAASAEMWAAARVGEDHALRIATQASCTLQYFDYDWSLNNLVT